MKIGIACTNAFTIPVPESEIYANQNMAGWIADRLSEKKADVTLFAPKGSRTKAKLVTFGMLPYSDPRVHKVLSAGCSFSDYEHLFMAKIYNYALENKFDVLHMHLRPLSVAPFSAMSKIPTIQTIHDPLNYKYFKILECYNSFKQIGFVSISFSQRKPLPGLKMIGNVYNGISLEKWTFNPKGGKYLCWSGRVLPEKATHIAIKVARKTNIELKMAGYVYNNDKNNPSSYWNKKVKPNLSRKITLEYLQPKEQNYFYGNAKAFINPIQWEEPFGLVMIEAMACGTPVIAFNRGSVPEIVKHGETGFIVNNEKEMIEAIKRIDMIDRRKCRERVEKHFTVEKMVDEYEKVYRKIINKNKTK
jgi:glycosyltransferase involved in cell wall biosynthesis